MMVERQLQAIARESQIGALLRRKWQAELKRAVDKVKLGVVTARKQTKTDSVF